MNNYINLKRSWVEIDLNIIIENAHVCQNLFSGTQEIMAIVKADAYNHGEIQVSRILNDIGIKHFAVSNLNEALNLRNAGVSGQILVLGYTPSEYAEILIENDLTQAIFSQEYAEVMMNMGIKAHFQLDTGMRRLGINTDYPEECVRLIRQYSKKFKLTGLFTHLSVADIGREEEFTTGQVDKFKEIVSYLLDLEVPYIHCLNSAGGLWHNIFGNLVRVGILLYGLKPNYLNVIPSNIKPALVWKSVVIMVKTIQPGDFVGYGKTFLASEVMDIATVSTGYADGYPRILSNKGYVMIRGIKAAIVGQVCMDQMMIDVTGIKTKVGDEVILLGESVTADDLAYLADSISYEVICGISKRVDRKYIY